MGSRSYVHCSTTFVFAHTTLTSTIASLEAYIQYSKHKLKKASDALPTNLVWLDTPYLVLRACHNNDRGFSDFERRLPFRNWSKYITILLWDVSFHSYQLWAGDRIYPRYIARRCRNCEHVVGANLTTSQQTDFISHPTLIRLTSRHHSHTRPRRQDH